MADFGGIGSRKRGRRLADLGRIDSLIGMSNPAAAEIIRLGDELQNRMLAIEEVVNLDDVASEDSHEAKRESTLIGIQKIAELAVRMPPLRRYSHWKRKMLFDISGQDEQQDF